MSTDLYRDVKELHEHFGFEHRILDSVPNQALLAFRLKFLAEELSELNAAVVETDMPEILDALIDLVYVALGTAWLLNLPFPDGWNMVHEANMKKVRVKSADDSKRGHAFDLAKPLGWVPPDLPFLFTPNELAMKGIFLGRQRVQLEQVELVSYIQELDHDA